MVKKTIEDQISGFFMMLGSDGLIQLLRDIIPLFELYDLEDENDWVAEEVGEENQRNVRLIRTVYLISRLADIHAGKLCRLNIKFKDLWKKMRKHTEDSK